MTQSERLKFKVCPVECFFILVELKIKLVGNIAV